MPDVSNPTAATVEPASNSRNERRAVWIYRAKLGGTLLLPVFLETLDYTVVATAQPYIASAFNRLDLQSYIGTVYILTSTVFLPIFASLSDVFGRYWAMQLSLIMFLIGCALSTGAQNMPMMLAGRGIAGIGAAGLLTVVRVILSDSTSLDSNNFQSAMLVILYSIGFSIGPYLGGVLTGVNFRWVFGINIPCTFVSIILCFILLRGIAKPPQSRRYKSKEGAWVDMPPHQETFREKILRLDTVGASVFTAGGILVLLGLNWGSTGKWNDGKVISSLVLGIFLLVAFVIWEWFADRDDTYVAGQTDATEKIIPPRSISWTRPETMIPLDIFKNYDVCATQFAAFSSGMVMLVNFYFLSIFFTIVLNKSPSSSGLQLIFFAPGMGVGTIASIWLIKRLRQPKIPIIIGMTLVPIGLGFLSFAMQHNNEGVVDGFLVLCGVGIGMTFGPLAIHARFSQPENRVAIIVGLNLFFRSFGGTVGLAQCGAILNAKVHSFIKDLINSGTLPLDQTEQLESLGDINSIQVISSLPPELAQHVRDGFRAGVRWAFISLIPWTAPAAIMVLFLSKIPDTDLPSRGRAAPEGGGGQAGRVAEGQGESVAGSPTAHSLRRRRSGESMVPYR
ncbi:major facilitator superfamily domain-containing protein [Hysterangium stoloniferum]|nr:major facilitator superfamily domain-containing protein [Hysterangium stoloniferum]